MDKGLVSYNNGFCRQNLPAHPFNTARIMLYILLILLAIAAFVYFSNSKKAAEKQAPEKEIPLVIENVRPGGVVQLEGIGPDLKDFDVVIKARHSYNEDGFVWHELEGEDGTKPVWIEIERDDELEVSVCLRKLKLSEIGITGGDVEKIEADDKGSIEFEGTQYIYEDCGDATFYRDGVQAGSGERVHYWDFETKDGSRYLSVERWGSKEYVAYLSEPLRPGQIKVFSVS